MAYTLYNFVKSWPESQWLCLMWFDSQDPNNPLQIPAHQPTDYVRGNPLVWTIVLASRHRRVRSQIKWVQSIKIDP